MLQDFLLLFFLWISSPEHQSIPLGPFWIFPKICGDIHKSRCTTGINYTGGEFATGVNNTSAKIAVGMKDNGGR